MNSEDKRPHAPGVWVLYFSLAALPLFGLGELFIPRDAGAVRTAAFQDLVIYTASALALLVTTSFLGMRRYLRQRKVEMPTEIAATWIGGGAAVVIAVLVACLVIPRPYSETSITAWLEKQSQAPAGDASDYAVADGKSGEGEGRAIGQGEKPAENSDDSGGSSKHAANSQQGRPASRTTSNRARASRRRRIRTPAASRRVLPTTPIRARRRIKTKRTRGKIIKAIHKTISRLTIQSLLTTPNLLIALSRHKTAHNRRLVKVPHRAAIRIKRSKTIKTHRRIHPNPPTATVSQSNGNRSNKPPPKARRNRTTSWDRLGDLLRW